MDYKHKSGAQKRKEKFIRERNAHKGQKTLAHLGFVIKEKNEEGTENSVNNNDPETCERTQSNMKTVQHQPQEMILDLESQREPAATLDNKLTETVEEQQNAEEEKNVPVKKLNTFDIGQVRLLNMTSVQIETAEQRGHESHPAEFPDDIFGHRFPIGVLYSYLRNGEKLKRDWLVWSSTGKALFCFPCRLFSKFSDAKRSALTLASGYSINKKINKKRIKNKSSVDLLLFHNIKTEAARWRQILRRILDVVLFLGERGLAFRGSNTLIGDPKNGNFLGILELISLYDLVLQDHLQKVKESQKRQRRLQVHYLSPETQNEFIDCCASQVIHAIHQERESAKYYSIIVDATPDSPHVEQTVFVLRYVLLNKESHKYEVKERFLEFVDCNKKTGEAIADLMRATLKKHNIPLVDCRGQGYDNGSNMSGQYKGAQSHILKDNPLATFSPCACHSLNLCGVQAAECTSEVITFFGVLQKLYNIFSSSPQRWEILQNHIGCSLHSMCQTRWSARIDSVKPFAANISGLRKAINSVMTLNLTPETKSNLSGIESYITSFDCILLSSIWFKVLTAVNHRSSVLQARDATLDVEMENIRSLIVELKHLRTQWKFILEECKTVAKDVGFADNFEEKRCKIRKRHSDESVEEAQNANPETNFKQSVFYVLLDCLIANMTRRFDAFNTLEANFSFFWKYTELNEEKLKKQATSFCELYSVDVSMELVEEIVHLKVIHDANLGQESLPPLRLLNKLHCLKLEMIFPNICIGLRIFCTIPVSVAEGERSFSLLSCVKNFLRSTMSQNRLSNLGTLALESFLARTIDFESIISTFADRKARSVL